MVSLKPRQKLLGISLAALLVQQSAVVKAEEESVLSFAVVGSSENIAAKTPDPNVIIGNSFKTYVDTEWGIF